MEINLNEIRGNSLVRYGFRVLLAKEFGLYLKEQEVEKILLAESCIEVYEDVEAAFVPVYKLLDKLPAVRNISNKIIVLKKGV